MDYSFIDRLKSKVIAGAQSSAAKIEEAARTGKLHLDLMAERRKLLRAFTEVGKEAYAALIEDSVAGLAHRPGVAELESQIARHQKEIVNLEALLAAQNKKGP